MNYALICHLQGDPARLCVAILREPRQCDLPAHAEASYSFADDRMRVQVFSMGFKIEQSRAEGLARSFRSDKQLFVRAFCDG